MNTTSTVICLCGFQGVGKDYIADILCCKYNFTKFQISRKLKEICKILFGFSYEQLHGKKKNDICTKWNISPRTMFEYIGTDIFQFDIQKKLPTVERNFWINSIIDDMKTCDYVVISDLRFKHEIDVLKNHFENVIIINVVNYDTFLNHNRTNVESEHLKIPFDFQIFNSKLNPSFHTDIAINYILKS